MMYKIVILVLGFGYLTKIFTETILINYFDTFVRVPSRLEILQSTVE